MGTLRDEQGRACWLLAVAAAVALARLRAAETPSPSPRRRSRRPAIGEAGVLRVGRRPVVPAVRRRRRRADRPGIDVDVAAALAERLGLAVELRRRRAVRGRHRARRRNASTSCCRCRCPTPTLYAADRRRHLPRRRPRALRGRRRHGSVEPSMTLRSLPVAQGRGAEGARRRTGCVAVGVRRRVCRGASSRCARRSRRVDRGERRLSRPATRSSAPTSRATSRACTSPASSAPRLRSAAAVGRELDAGRCGSRARSTSWRPTGCSTRSARKWVGDLPALESPDAGSTSARSCRSILPLRMPTLDVRHCIHLDDA